MESAKRMIDKAVSKCSPQTRTELARVLGVSPQRLNDWSSGYRHMPTQKAMTVAAIGHMDPIRTLGEYEAEWLAKKGSALVTGAVAVCLLGAGLLGGSGDASAKPVSSYTANGVTIMHIMRRRFGRFWARFCVPQIAANTLTLG